jgi:hypothetical protein
MNIPSELSELLTWAESWLPTLAPADLAGRPVYVVPQELPATIGATVGPDMDLAYRCEIGERWRGRGVAILIDPAHFALDVAHLREISHASNFDLEMMRHYVARKMLQLLLHEMAHAVLMEPPAETPRVTQRQARQTIDEWYPPAEADPRLPAPWMDHEADFVRACLHLRYRAKSAGVVLPLQDLAAGWTYRMAKIETYSKALGREPAKMAGLSFKEIATTLPPREFTALWIADVTNWVRSCAKHDGLSDEIFQHAVWAANALPGDLITQEYLAASVAA